MKPAALVLVVDDDEDSRELLAEALLHRGFAVETASSGSACLASLDVHVSETVIVLTDVEMPEMTGLELCTVMRARYANVVAVVMSGRATATIAAQAKEHGAYAFVPKPIGVRALEVILRSAMALDAQPA